MLKRDGGWGWFIVLASFLTLSLWTACMRCYSTFFYPLMNEFQVEYGAVSWLNGLFQIGYGISCAFAPVLFKYLDYRQVVMGGGLISSGLLLCGSLANSLWLVQVCCSLGVGLCMGGILIGCFTCVTRYFEDRRVLALQITSVGASLGGFVYCPSFQFLIDIYTWRGAMQIISGLYLNITAFGALLRPITLVEDSEDLKISTLNQHGKNAIVQETLPSLPNPSQFEIEEMSHLPPTSPLTHGGQQKPESSVRLYLRNIYDTMDLVLLFQSNFYLYIFAWVSFAAAFFSILGYLAPYGRSIGFSSIDAAALVSAYAVGEMCARVFHGLVFNRIRPDYRYPMLAGMKLAASGCFFAMPFTLSYAVIVILCGFIGFCIGGIDAIYNVILVDLFGVKLYAAAFGYGNLVINVCGMGITVAVGSIIDISGSVANAFPIGGAFLLLSAALLLIMDRRIKIINQRKTKEKSFLNL